MDTLRDVYVADFETITTEPTRVWAWALTQAGNLKRDKVVLGNDISTFFDYIFAKNRSMTIYFHNLSFDGYFILYYFLKKKYKLINKYKPQNNKEYTELIDENGEIYSIQIKNNCKIFRFFDSFKIYTNSLGNLAKSFNTKYQKLKIDYKMHEYNNYNIDENEKDYIINDVLILSELMYKYYKKFNYAEMTISSQSFKNYKKNNFVYFKRDFLQLDEDVDEFFRGGYRGGLCLISPEIKKNKIIKCNGATYDYNSMYPSMLHSKSGNYYPVGKPVKFERKDFEKILNKNYCFCVKISCKFKIKKNKIPCVSSLKSIFSGVDKWETESKTMTLLTLTDVDYKLFVENYNIYDLSFHKGYYFKNKKIGLFDDYIDFWYKYKKDNDLAIREFAKMMLNGLIGKFGQRLKMGRKYVGLDKETQKFKNYLKVEKTNPIYLPVSMWCTAYARKELVNAINKNYDNFLYCDTDSIHLRKKTKNIKIGDDLLQWKKENNIIKAKYIKAKCYIEKIDKKKYLVKIAGLPKEARPEFKNDKIFDYYKEGLMIKNCKLRQTKVVGGVVLKETDFTIK